MGCHFVPSDDVACSSALIELPLQVYPELVEGLRSTSASLFIFSYFRAYMQDVDIIRDILEQTEIAFPESGFVKSLHQQYLNRGGLSKKQLEGLYQKAQKVKTISAGKLSTLEAIILKKPTRYKSEKPEPTPLYKKDEGLENKIIAILEKYPQHKRVLFLKTKFDNNEILNSTEIADIEKFHKLLK